jgi:hypothetical protein
MTTESWNSSLIDNGSLGTFPQQRIGLWRPKRCYEINTRFYVDVDSWSPTSTERVPMSTDKQQTLSMVTGDNISGHEKKNGFILHSSFVLSDSLVIRRRSE